MARFSAWPGALVLALLYTTTAMAVDKPACPVLSDDQRAQIEAGKVVVYASKEDPDSSVATATGIVEIQGTEAEIFAVLCSEAHSEAASKAMKDCQVVEDEQVGTGHRRLTVTYLMKVVTQDIQWTVVRDVYEGQGLLTFEIDPSYDNDIAWTAGQYSLYPGSSSDKTMVVYVSNLDSGRRIPQWVEEELTEGSLKKYLRYLKTATEAQ